MDKIEKLHELLEVSAGLFPDNIAVCYLDRSITYHQLNSSSNLISDDLKAIGAKEGSRVAICAPKSIDFVSSIFGILKSGAAYLPVDYSSPIERNKFIIQNGEVSAIIISKELFHYFESEFSFVSDLDNNLVIAKNNNSLSKKSPPDLAYILYTSGSTGIPKGVMYSNSAALEFVNWSSEIFKPSHIDTFSSHAPFHFDLSIFDLFVSIKHGAKLVLIKEEVGKQPLLLAKLIAEQKISIWYSTPSILNMLAEYGKMEKYDFGNLRFILFAGEVFPITQFKVLKNKVPAAVYYNLYGPTETNVCTYYRLTDQLYTQIPIGKVCEHYRCLIVDEEIFIRGSGVMLGYWNLPEQDAFWKDSSNNVWYKTGDLVDIDGSGNYIFKGRRDRMVKRNGYRIELDEIEVALDKHDFISKSAVLGNANSDGQMIISAIILLKTDGEKSVIKMKEYCMNNLPSYMVPNDIVFVEDLPYTSSHKVDYQKLKLLI